MWFNGILYKHRILLNACQISKCLPYEVRIEGGEFKTVTLEAACRMKMAQSKAVPSEYSQIIYSSVDSLSTYQRAKLPSKLPSRS